MDSSQIRPRNRKLLRQALQLILLGGLVFWVPDLLVRLIQRPVRSADVARIAPLFAVGVMLAYSVLWWRRSRSDGYGPAGRIAVLVSGTAGAMLLPFSGAWSLACSYLGFYGFHVFSFVALVVWFFIRRDAAYPISIFLGIGVWLLGPIFMLLGAAAMAPGFDLAAREYALLLVLLFSPKFTFIAATYDGSLAALNTVSLMLIILFVVVELPWRIRGGFRLHGNGNGQQLAGTSGVLQEHVD